jgi:hypothetical protein
MLITFPSPSCFRMLIAQPSWHEFNKCSPLVLKSNKFLPKLCAIALARNQTSATLVSSHYFHYSNVFILIILLSEGRAGLAWEHFNKMTLLLSLTNKCFSLLLCLSLLSTHFLCLSFRLLSYYILRFSFSISLWRFNVLLVVVMHFTYQSNFSLHSLIF